MKKAFLKKVAYSLPERVVSNSDLSDEFPEWSPDKILSKVGIQSRHIAGENETSLDLAYSAARNLFDTSNVAVEEVDFVLFCTQSPDYVLPTTACLLQERLGLRTSIGALDFNLGCSAYVYGLALAKSLVIAGMAKCVLFVTAETYSKYIAATDKSNRAIFGDAASASLICDDGVVEIGEFSFGTDGRGADKLIVPNSGSRRDSKLGSQLFMDGAAVFNFTLESVPKLIENTLLINSIKKSEVGLYIFHQANAFMLETLRKVCGIPMEKFLVDMADVGNTVSATIPIALSRKGGCSVELSCPTLIAGFGVGYSWAGTMLNPIPS